MPAIKGRARYIRDDGKTGRAVGVAENDEIAAVMSVTGHSLEEIAKAIGVRTPAGASHAVSRGLMNHPPADLDELRVTESLRLDALERELWEIRRRKHPVVSNGTGQIVRDENGQAVIDDAPAIAALTLILKISERRSRLLGLDSPKRTHVTLDTINAEVRRLELEIGYRKQDALPAAPAAAIEAPLTGKVESDSGSRAAIREPDGGLYSAEPETSDPEDEDEPEDEPAARPQPQRYERGGMQHTPPPQPVTDDGRRRDPEAGEDWARAYREETPQPEVIKGTEVVEISPGVRMSKRRTSWG